MRLASLIPFLHRPESDHDPLDYYNEHLRQLGQLNIPSERWDALNQMAFWADAVSSRHYLNAMAFSDEGGIDTAIRWERARHVRWGKVRDLCRAIAATEVGLILVDPSNMLPWLNELTDDFVLLAAAADDDDREKRARLLYALAGYFTEDETTEPDEFSGLTPSLDDIAATELTAYHLTLQAEEIAR